MWAELFCTSLMKAAKGGRSGKTILHLWHLNLHSLAAFSGEVVGKDFPVACPIPPTWSSSSQRTGWRVKGHTPFSIEARDHSHHRPPPHTHKRRQNFSIHAVKGKDLEFPNVMTSVQIADLDWDMAPPATSLYLPATIRSEMCQAPPQAAAGTRVYAHRKVHVHTYSTQTQTLHSHQQGHCHLCVPCTSAGVFQK